MSPAEIFTHHAMYMYKEALWTSNKPSMTVSITSRLWMFYTSIINKFNTFLKYIVLKKITMSEYSE